MRRIMLLVTAAAFMTAMMAVSALPAFAQGQVERGPEHARSICSFSGLNDDPEEAFPEDGRTQSYGQQVKKNEIKPSAVKSGAPSPGTFCNPQKSPFVGPFGL